MDIALAMKYGGAPISPDECDETSYRRLGLTCSCCKDLVRWIAPQERQVRDAVYPVKAHFRHFPSTDPVIAAQCERRVSAYPREEVERMAKKAIQQRSALFQRWFWQVIDSHITRLDLSGDNGLEEAMFLTGDCDEYRLTSWLERLVDGFAGDTDIANRRVRGVSEAQDYAESFMSSFATAPQDEIDSILSGISNPDDLLPEWLENTVRLSRSRLHQAIVKEAIAFLGNKRSRPHLQAIIMFLLIGSENFTPLLERSAADPAWQVITSYHLIHAIGIFMSLVPWAEEFERVKGASDMPSPSRSFAGPIANLLIRGLIAETLEGEP